MAEKWASQLTRYTCVLTLLLVFFRGCCRGCCRCRRSKERARKKICGFPPGRLSDSFNGCWPLLDKLETRIEQETPLSASVSQAFAHLRAGYAIPGFARSRHYAHVGDLRKVPSEFGLPQIPAILHLGNKHGNAAHKLEHLDTGSRSFEQLLDESAQVVNVHPLTLQVMRVDLAADIEAVPVEWFKTHARAQYKRFGSEFGKFELEYSEMGKREVETLYFGKRPNCLRIYNKLREWRAQYDKAFRIRTKKTFDTFDGERLAIPWELVPRSISETDPTFSNDPLPISDLVDEVQNTEAQSHGNLLPKPTFEAWIRDEFGRDLVPATLTRVERQVAAGRVPDECSQVGKIPYYLSKFNPFERLKLQAAADPRPLVDLESLPVGIAERVLYVRYMIEKKGNFHNAYAAINRRKDGKAKKYFEGLEPYLPQAGGSLSPDLTEARLLESFRESAKSQGVLA